MLLGNLAWCDLTHCINPLKSIIKGTYLTKKILVCPTQIYCAYRHKLRVQECRHICRPIHWFADDICVIQQSVDGVPSTCGHWLGDKPSLWTLPYPKKYVATWFLMAPKRTFRFCCQAWIKSARIHSISPFDILFLQFMAIYPNLSLCGWYICGYK